MALLVAPVLHNTVPPLPEAVSVTLPEPQKVVVPEAVMLGVAGIGLTVTDKAADTDEVQLPEIRRTV
jgi:hypothetical protein